MKDFLNKITRQSRKWTDQFIIAGILSFILILLGMELSSVILNAIDSKTLFEKILGSANLAEFFSEYLSFFGIWIVIFIVLYVFRDNRPMLKAWKRNKEGNNWKFALIGAALGFGTNGFCVLMSILLKDIKLSFYGFNPGILLGFLAVIFIQSGAEEIADRLYLYQKLRRRYINPWVAIAGNAVIFSAMHAMNNGFTLIAGLQIVLVGIIFALLVYYYNSLWGAIWFHTLWNFTQNIIFGLPNSGRVSEYSIFKLEASTATSGFFYDYSFGVEGSIGACIVLAVVLGVILYINRGKSEKHDYWLEEMAKN